MNTITTIGAIWPIFTFLLMLAASFGGLLVMVKNHTRELASEREDRDRRWIQQERINSEIFSQMKEHRQEMIDLLKMIQAGGIAVHECPFQKEGK